MAKGDWLRHMPGGLLPNSGVATSGIPSAKEVIEAALKNQKGTVENVTK